MAVCSTLQKATTKSVDENKTAGAKLFKSILSLDGGQQQTTAIAPPPTTTTTGGSGNNKQQQNAGEKSITPSSVGSDSTAPATATAANQSSSAGHELRGAASTLFSAATTTISNKINELVNGVALTDGLSSANNNASAKLNSTSPGQPTPASSVVAVENNNSSDYFNGDNLAIEQHNLVFPNENPSVFVERRENSGGDSVLDDELGEFHFFFLNCPLPYTIRLVGIKFIAYLVEHTKLFHMKKVKVLHAIVKLVLLRCAQYHDEFSA